IKELVMAKYNLAAKGKYWGKPAGKAGADGTIIGNDGAFYMPVPEWWPKRATQIPLMRKLLNQFT
ncbi:hypothetical protein AAULR_26151, partial [Lacticaseibacillus rhamnosus MTCC 5462]